MIKMKAIFEKFTDGMPSCEYKGCRSLYYSESRFCDEHSAIGSLVEDVERFFNTVEDPAVGKRVKAFSAAVHPLGEGFAGMALSPNEMQISSSVLDGVGWRVLRHELGHLLDWYGGTGPHGFSWHKRMAQLGYEGFAPTEVFQMAAERVLPDCLIEVRYRGRRGWSVKIGDLS